MINRFASKTPKFLLPGIAEEVISQVKKHKSRQKKKNKILSKIEKVSLAQVLKVAFENVTKKPKVKQTIND